MNRNQVLFSMLSPTITKTNSLLEITQENNNDENNALNFIIRKLNHIESRIERSTVRPNFPHRSTMRFRFGDAPESIDIENIKQMLQIGLSHEMLHIMDVNVREASRSIVILYVIDAPIDVPGVYGRITDILSEVGFTDVSLITGMRPGTIE